MKKDNSKLIKSFAICLFIILSTLKPLLAQSYRPFFNQAGVLFQYEYSTLNDHLLHSLRIDSVSVNAADTTFHFNRLGFTYPGNGPCPPGDYLDHLRNMFGEKMIARPAGEFYFVDDLVVDTVFLKTQAPLNTPWSFHSLGGITAQIISRTEMTFLGATDTILTISLSDGALILLSKNHGMISSPNFSHYMNFEIRYDFSYFRLPAQPQIDLEDAFTWQVGDVAEYVRNHNQGYYVQIFHQELHSRVLSSGGDVLTYEWNQRRIDMYPGTDTILSPWSMVTEVHSQAEVDNHSFLHLPNRRFTTDTVLYGEDIGEMVLSAGFHAGYGDREYKTSARLRRDSCSYMHLDFTGFDQAYRETFVLGLGVAQEREYYYTTLPNTIDYDLVCYTQATDSLLPCNSVYELLTDLLEQKTENKMTFRLGPNPMRRNIKLAWTGMAAEAVNLNIYDVQGCLVSTSSINGMQASGQARLDFDLKPGLYFFSIWEGNEILYREKLIVIGD